MNIETLLTNTIEKSDEKPMYDEVCKQILSNKIILAWIMKECVPEYQNRTIEEIATRHIEGQPDPSSHHVITGEMIGGMATENIGLTGSNIFYDIRFRATAPSDDGLIELIINVEAQNKYNPGYSLVKRGIYYDSCMIASQYGTDFTKYDYQKIKKVYTIWICRNVPKYLENSITSYHMTEKNLVGNVREKRSNYDLMSVVMVYLGNTTDKQQSDLLNLLNTLLSEEVRANEKIEVLSTEYDIPRDEKLESEVQLMCNLSQGIEEKGIKQGREDERIEVAKSMLSDDMPLSTISKHTNLSLEKIKGIQDEMNKHD